MVFNSTTIAVDLLREVYTQVVAKLKGNQHHPAAISEAVRILTLSKAISHYDTHSDSKFEEGVITELSPTAFRNHVDPITVQNMVADFSSDITTSLDAVHFPREDILFLTDVLGSIHSIGSHTIPPRGFSIKRLQGAFYTPSTLAYFIAERTIKPVLENLWLSCNKDESSFVNELLNLTIIDPCCGPGVFLIGALQVIRSIIRDLHIYKKIPLKKLVKILYGVDIDPASLEIARLCLSYSSGRKISLQDTYEFSENLFTGNSIINLFGPEGERHEHFFKNHSSRQAFEWRSKLASVFKDGGFDFILFNPPYERLKPNLAEFVRENLKAGYVEINLEEYRSYKTLINEDLNYYRNSGEYRHSIFSTLNTYQLFIERAIQIAKQGGHIGFVVPSTLLGDSSSRNLRRYLLFENEIKSVDEFTESARLFPNVTQSVCVTVVKKEGSSKSFPVRNWLESIEDAYSTPSYRVTTKGITEVFGKSLAIPRVNAEDWKILQKIHSHPTLSSYEWILNHRGELDLTLDKQFIKEGKGPFRLIRGRDIGRYNLLPTTQNLEHVSLSLFKKSKKNSERIHHSDNPRLACQQVSNLRNRWRLKFSRIEDGFILANSCNYVAVKLGSPQFALDYLLGIFNSLLLNWRFYVSSTNNHVSNRELALLPVVNPLEDRNRDLAKRIAKQVKTIKKNTARIIPEIEALVFKLYGISSEEVERILRSRDFERDEEKLILEYI